MAEMYDLIVIGAGESPPSFSLLRTSHLTRAQAGSASPQQKHT